METVKLWEKQTPYFVPDETFLTVLRMACLSGIDVRIMLPQKPDKPYVYGITLSYAEELLKAGAKIYLRGGILCGQKEKLLLIILAAILCWAIS